MKLKRWFTHLVLLAALTLCGPFEGMAEEKGRPLPGTQTVREGVIIEVVSAGEMVLWTKKGLYPFSLYGLSLPVLSTPEGAEAKRKASDIIFNKLLTVHFLNHGSEKPAGIVMVRGECLNLRLVEDRIARVAEDCRLQPYCRQWQEKQ
ncbi:MAG TPA: hypothetical protein DHV36_19990 [Desulfobacteraceae bacterium]|nr:hypothetical protein [Desulfobacteraceae bacterium]|tara:strand:+ start:2035 stop:2478 length:444 start_codon:yes stop_codon:yes gene_type:complete